MGIYVFLMKVANFHIIGHIAVGKTSIIRRYVHDVFEMNYVSTIGADFQSKKENINGTTVCLHIYDTAGQEKFESLTKNLLRNSNGVIIVFDLSNEESFKKVEKWIKYVDDSNVPNIQMVLVGNKSDCDHVVKKDDAQAIADNYQINYFETSALNGSNINDVFKYLTNISLNYLSDSPDVSIKQEGSEDNQGGRRCC